MILKIRIVLIFFFRQYYNSIQNESSTNLSLVLSNHKYECYTYQTLKPYIKSIAIAEAPNFNLSLIQEVAKKGTVKTSLIFTTKFISIWNEKEVAEEQLFI